MSCCIIAVAEFLSQWFECRHWITVGTPNLGRSVDEELKKALKVNVYLLIKWLLEEISRRELILQSRYPGGSYAKVRVVLLKL